MNLKTKTNDRLSRYLRNISEWLKRKLTSDFTSDRLYAEKRFLKTFGRKLDLKNPVTLMEKIQWLKLYDRRPIKTDLTDKYLVREYVQDKVGEQYLNPCYGVYESADELIPHLFDFPDKYILKATHGCGWNIIVNDPSSPTEGDLNELRNWLSTNYYYAGREWCYKHIKPRIVCEELIEPVNPDLGIVDFNFFCFHGEPIFLYVALDPHGDYRYNIFDQSLQQFPYVYPESKQLPEKLKRPADYDLMFEIVRRLSEGFSFVRVDLYFERKILFGEMTFYPGCGFTKIPEEYDRIFGEYMKLL
jgi:hypothetical protein